MTRTRRTPRTGASGVEGSQPPAEPSVAEQQGGANREDHRQRQQERQGRSKQEEPRSDLSVRETGWPEVTDWNVRGNRKRTQALG